MLWNEEQVSNLNRRQHNQSLHPYTCGVCSKDLQATQNGWMCPEHGLVQTWAHKEDLGGRNADDGRSLLNG